MREVIAHDKQVRSGELGLPRNGHHHTGMRFMQSSLYRDGRQKRSALNVVDYPNLSWSGEQALLFFQVAHQGALGFGRCWGR